MLTSKASDSNFAGDHYGQLAPPNIRGGKKKIRPFSAPRHQSMRSQGLKQKAQMQAAVGQPGGMMMPMQPQGMYQDNAYMMAGQPNLPQPQYMETVNEQTNNQQYFQTDEQNAKDMEDEEEYGEEEDQYEEDDMEGMDD